MLAAPPAPIPESVYIQGDAPWWPLATLACDHHVPWFVKHRSHRDLTMTVVSSSVHKESPGSHML